MRSSSLAQSTVSAHLQVLRRAGVVGVVRRGPERWYRLRPGTLAAFAREVERLSLLEETDPTFASRASGAYSR